MSIERMRTSLCDEMRLQGKPGGDPKLQAYLGSPYKVLGLATPQMRDILNNFVKANQNINAGEVNLLTDSLWSGSTHEEKVAAISLLGRFSKILNNDSWSLAEGWIEQAVGWALCDSLGSGPISTMLYKQPSRFKQVLEWTSAENYWRRRIATYALNDFVRMGELDKPFTLLEKLLYDKEFWVQRAVGTWLRECWKKDRRRTERFLLDHVEGLPKVVITVATERAPVSFRKKLREAR